MSGKSVPRGVLGLGRTVIERADEVGVGVSESSKVRCDHMFWFNKKGAGTPSAVSWLRRYHRLSVAPLGIRSHGSPAMIACRRGVPGWG